MAKKFSLVFIGYVLFALEVSVCYSSASSQRHWNEFKGLIRNKRQSCVDGTYNADNGNLCCRCAAGQHLKEDCSSKDPNDRICEHCESETFNSQANSLKTCQPCRSCTHLNANLVVYERCTIARDTKCQCKKDYFCTEEDCKICNPCKICGSAGVKEECTATRDTVCNDNSKAGVIAAAIVISLIVAGIVAAVLIWRKKQRKRPKNPDQNNGGETDLELKLISGVNLQPVMYDIANELKWSDMKEIAMRSDISDAIIESCQLNHPNDVSEQTLALLKKWVEREGKTASENLIKNLEKSNKKDKAEKIRKILTTDSSNSSKDLA